MEFRLVKVSPVIYLSVTQFVERVTSFTHQTTLSFYSHQIHLLKKRGCHSATSLQFYINFTCNQELAS